MAKADLADRAVEAVVNKLGSEYAINAKVTDDFPCGPGEVYTVEYQPPGRDPEVNYAHYDGRRFRIFPRSRDLVQYFARSAQWRNAVIHIFQAAGIAGVIGLVITLTICYLAIRGQIIPQILEHALTAILGFYFATAIYEYSKDRAA